MVKVHVLAHPKPQLTAHITNVLTTRGTHPSTYNVTPFNHPKYIDITRIYILQQLTFVYCQV